MLKMERKRDGILKEKMNFLEPLLERTVEGFGK